MAQQHPPTPTPPTRLPRPATDPQPPSLWFDPPHHDQDRRHHLTRQQVVTQALAIIAHDGVQALTMRRLAAHLGVVPGALVGVLLYLDLRARKERLDLGTLNADLQASTA